MLCVISQLLPALPCLISTSWFLIVVDSSYFTGIPPLGILREFLKADLSLMAATPFNSLIYNLSSSNLAEHGIHPRWLHAVVNWPMLFGVGLWAVADVGMRLRVKPSGKERWTTRFMDRGERRTS